MGAAKTTTKQAAKKEREITPDQKLDALMNRINTKAKHRVIGRAEDVPNPFFRRRPSGIMQLDIDTGGGLPAGGLTVISGPEGAGKTHLLSKYFKMQQRMYGSSSRVAMATVEFPPDHLYLRKRGVQVAVPDYQIDQLVAYRKQMQLAPLTKADLKELKTQVGRFDIITGATSEETLQATMDMLKTGLYSIIGVDSISVMLPEADQGKDMDERDARAGNAGLVTSFLKKYHPTTLGIDRIVNETSLMLLAQVRANSAKASAQPHIAKYLPDWVQTGAKALAHGKLIDIMVRTGEKLRVGSKENKKQVGKMLGWTITKGKAGTHDGITGEIEYHYDTGVDDTASVFFAATQAGIFVEAKGGFEFVRPETGEVLAEPMERADIEKMLETDPRFDTKIRLEILRTFGVECVY